MMFRPYMHVEKYGNEEVQDIELGQVHIFPKLDGTNASCWHQDVSLPIQAGSRQRHLSIEADNAGFCAYIQQQKNIESFLRDWPNLRLYGEWLVPHTFKSYRPDAWRKFYVFDVYNDLTATYMSYDRYKELLDSYSIEYIAPLAVITNGSLEHFQAALDKNLYLCPTDGTPGEGVVLKNYDYTNKFGRQCYAKLIRQEFKDAHNKTMGATILVPELLTEQRVIDKVVTLSLVDKTYEKIKLEKDGWSGKCIPELLNRVFYDVVKEELWDAWKDIKFATLNGKTLQNLCTRKIKQLKPELF